MCPLIQTARDTLGSLEEGISAPRQLPDPNVEGKTAERKKQTIARTATPH